MSDSDSFINEVTEEVRREKLYGYLRRYGWIAVVVVLALVGGAAFNEYRAAQARAAAEATGDALLAAFVIDDPQARAAAMAGIETTGASAAVALLLRAATQQEAGDDAAAAATLAELATAGGIPDLYRDLATLKAAMLPTGDLATRRASLEAISAPGRPFALLAQEQLAFLALETGDRQAALTILRQINEAAEATRGLRERAQTLMVALGDPLPEPVNQ
ncbi:hypothetical protein [Yoonia sp.]|uniref:hypothetical protein n=1 Tax=Yoonia sp. TaxID=2212373 RepID=UPI002FD9C101